MENQTYPSQIAANIFQLTHKRKSWQSLISVARNKHQPNTTNDSRQRVTTCLCDNSTIKINNKKKIRKKRYQDLQEEVDKKMVQQDDDSTINNHFVNQHEADTTMLKFKGKKSSYSNRLWLLNSNSTKGLRNSWFARSLLLATLFLASQLVEPANSWRIFEPGTEARDAFGSSSIISSSSSSSNNNNINTYTSLPINPTINRQNNQNQLLTPSTLSMAHASSVAEHPKASNPTLVVDLNRQQTVSSSKLESDSTNSRDSSLDSSSQQQLQPNLKHENGKQSYGSSHAGASIPNLAGKILDVASGEANKSSASLLSSLTEKLTNANSPTPSSQLLKPRKQSSESSSNLNSNSKQHVTNVEQQIINQHSNMFASHQRLTPTKQRDQKITSLMSSSSPSSINSRNSPFYSILDTFKSGISSRSSIVKAISDNKLARTLSEVGKSISSNKYVAGAAAASAIAALGLAASKFLSPYAFSGTSYSKIGGEPMLSSESMFRPNYLQLQNGDRSNILYTNPADPMFSANSNLATYKSIPNRQQSTSFSSFQAAGNDYNPYDLSQLSGGGDVQQLYQPAPSNAAGAGNNNNRVIVAYHSKQPQASSSSSQQASPGDSVEGYYGNFNGYKLADMAALPNNNNQYESYHPSAGAHTINLNEQSSSPPSFFVTSQNGNDYQASVNENDIPSHQATSTSPFELNSSSSFDNPISVYAYQTPARNKKQQQYQIHSSPLATQSSVISPVAGTPSLSSQSASTSRRSGPVSLKLDGATRGRLNELQRNNKQRWSALLQSPGAFDFSETDFKTLPVMSNSYQSPYPLTFPSLGSQPSQTSGPGSRFVPITAADATKATNNPEYSMKSSRLESDEQVDLPSSIGGGDDHASLSRLSKTRQQGQTEQQQQQQISYTIIRPKTSIQARAKLETSPEATSERQSDSDKGLRSFISKAAGTSWSAQTMPSKQTAASNHHNQEQGVDNNQAGLLNGGSQAEPVTLHRVSRTPNQSSVKQQVVSAQTTSGNPSENSKAPASTSGSGSADYELTAASENLSKKLLPLSQASSSGSYISSKELKSNNIQVLPYTADSGSFNKGDGGDKWQQQTLSPATNKQQLVAAHKDRIQAMDVEDNSTTNDDEVKTTANLIQLSADNSAENDSGNNSNDKNSDNNNNNNNNNVKLTEPDISQTSEPQQQQVAESADKLADTGLVIMLPTARNNGHSSDTSERRATSMKSTGELTTADSKQRHKMHSTSESQNINDELSSNREDKRDSPSLSSSSSSDNNTNEDVSPDTPFGSFIGAGYSLGGQ